MHCGIDVAYHIAPHSTKKVMQSQHILPWPQWQKYFRFGQAKYNASITHFCSGCEAADYPHKMMKSFDGSIYAACEARP